MTRLGRSGPSGCMRSVLLVTILGLVSCEGDPNSPSARALLLRDSGRCAKYASESVRPEWQEDAYKRCMEGGGHECLRRPDGVLDCGEESAVGGSHRERNSKTDAANQCKRRPAPPRSPHIPAPAARSPAGIPARSSRPLPCPAARAIPDTSGDSR